MRRSCGGGGGYLGIVVRVRERFVGGLGEGKWIALMDMVGRSSSFFSLFLVCFCNRLGDVEFRMVQRGDSYTYMRYDVLPTRVDGV